MMDGRGAKVGHADRRRTRAPPLQQAVRGVEDPKPVGVYAPLSNQTRGDMDAVNASTDDEPVEHHGTLTAHGASRLSARNYSARSILCNQIALSGAADSRNRRAVQHGHRR